MVEDSIIEYYNKTLNAYKDGWALEKNRQLNMGLWFPGTKSLSEALQNLNEELARKANISAGHRVLDAGCGVGGTCIHLASRYDCNAYGITLVPGQVELAQRFAMESNVSDRTDFRIMNYCHTTFPDNYFDAIVGIESICHTPDKRSFLTEALRILKPGGRLVFAENLQAKPRLTPKEHKILYTYAYEGCKISTLFTGEQYLTNLKELGFSDYKIDDVTPYIWPSIRRMRRLYYFAWIYNKYRAWAGRPFGPTELAHTRMCYYLYTSLKRNLWSYGLVQATK